MDLNRLKMATPHLPRRPMRLSGPRRGTVLLIVLVVIVFLALGAYTYTAISVAEHHAAVMYGRQVQARAFADSGIEYVAGVIGNPDITSRQSLYNNPDLFRSQLVPNGDEAKPRGRFTVIAPLKAAGMQQSVRYGLVDESAKLNVNSLRNEDDTTAQQMLLGLPEMTEPTASAILDWLDEDDQTRENGAENDYYLSLPTPYTPTNGPLKLLDELLMIRDVTPQLLYGEDANHNGLLDPNENDGDSSAPPDNADGVLQEGWSNYLTIYSRETTRQPDGSSKIRLNSDSLVNLYDDLAKQFDEQTAQFVVAFRLYGPMSDPNAEEQESTSGATSGGVVQPSSQPQAGTTQPSRTTSQSQANSPEPGSGITRVQVMRGGLDVGRPPKYSVSSIFELIAIKVPYVNETGSLIESPWSSSADELQLYLPELEKLLTTSNGDYIEGRININQAPYEVLVGIPGITESTAGDIVGSRTRGVVVDPFADWANGRSSIAWLYYEQLVEFDALRELARYATTRGDVYRVQVLGFFDTGRPICQDEAVIDATFRPARVVFFRELSNISPAYSRDLIAVDQVKTEN